MTKHRLQFDFTEEAVKEIDDLREAAELPSRAELIRYSLKFLRWALRMIRDEHATLLVEKEGKIREVVFPFWASNGGARIKLSEKAEFRDLPQASVTRKRKIAANQPALKSTSNELNWG
jgi:Arc/MetJ-type ribon-helix-helix transcriptional regulator